MLNEKNKWRWIVLAYAGIFALYFFNNKVSIKEPVYLKMTPFDVVIPFWPWTSWIYILVYVYPIYLVVELKKLSNIKVALIAGVVTGLICNGVFLFYPTTYLRPEVMNVTLGSLPLVVVQALDSPLNCFPSAHVAFAFLAAFLLGLESQKKSMILLVGAILISISTLTTKQHYVYDVLAGYIIARVVSLVAKRYT